MHYAILRFFVSLQASDNLACTDIHFGKAAQAQDRVYYPTRGDAVRATHAKRDVSGCYHSPGHRFAMKQACVARFSFESMTDGVTEIQHPAQALLTFVGGHNFG